MRAPQWWRRGGGSADPDGVFVGGPGDVMPEVEGPLSLVLVLTSPPPAETVSEEWLGQMLEVTKARAPDRLDTRYGGDRWRREIRTHGVLEGPEAIFTLLVDPRRAGKDSQTVFLDRVESEFRQQWSSALAR